MRDTSRERPGPSENQASGDHMRRKKGYIFMASVRLLIRLTVGKQKQTLCDDLVREARQIGFCTYLLQQTRLEHFEIIRSVPTSS